MATIKRLSSLRWYESNRDSSLPPIRNEYILPIRNEAFPMRDDNHIDMIHDIIVDHAGSHQAALAGILDTPLASAILRMQTLSPALSGTESTMMVLNHVGRFLRDAYGPESYEEGLRLAQADLHIKGMTESVQVLEEALFAQVPDMGEKIAEEMTPIILRREKRMFAIGLFCGLFISLSGILGFALGYAGY